MTLPPPYQDHNGERGSFTLLAAGAFVGLLGFLALVIDVGNLLVTRRQLQNVADTVAAAGSRELGRVYTELGDIDPGRHPLTTWEKARINLVVEEFARLNEVAGHAVSVAPGDVAFGRWDSASRTFTATDVGATGLRVAMRYDSSADGAIGTFLGSVTGADKFKVSAAAGTEIGPVGKLPAGKMDLPVAISEAWFAGKESACSGDTEIKLYSTEEEESCSAWHTYRWWPAYTPLLRFLLVEFERERLLSPKVEAGRTAFRFIHGSVESALPDIEALYDARKDEEGEWEVHIPVYASADCESPEGPRTIVGIATAVVTEVRSTGEDKEVRAKIVCDVVDYGHGSAPNFGTYLAIPRLVG